VIAPAAAAALVRPHHAHAVALVEAQQLRKRQLEPPGNPFGER
jgi:hypothetical protein